MKRTVLTAMMMTVAGTVAFAGHNTPAAGPAVTACLLDGPMDSKYAVVPGATTAIFAKTGVNLVWRDARHCPADALHISFTDGAAAKFHPGALAYALPFEGTHIVVLLDRVIAMIEKPRVPALLAHVLAHEITHILQGCDHHSASGVMKARWSGEDYRQMSVNALPFTPLDIAMIFDGIAHRAVTETPDASPMTSSPRF